MTKRKPGTRAICLAVVTAWAYITGCSTPQRDSHRIRLDFVDRNGVLTGMRNLETADDTHAAIASSPDGSYLVVSTAGDTYFLRKDGSVLMRWNAKARGEVLLFPAIAQNGRKVAFVSELLLEREEAQERRLGVAFFTPTGLRISRSVIPPVGPPPGVTAFSALGPAPTGESRPAGK